MNFIPSFSSRFTRPTARPEMLEYESEKLLGHQSSDMPDEMIDLERLRPRHRRFNTFLTWIWRLIIACLSVWAFIDISLSTWHFYRGSVYTKTPLESTSCSCGNSVADAVSMGCRFDALASAWLPPACIDEQLSYEFDHAGPGPDGSWFYYTDYAKTGTYTLEQVSFLADTGTYYYNTMAWHLAHCTYNWRKAVRSKWTGVTLEYRSDTEEHVQHCEMMFKDRTPLDYVGTVSIVTTNADWNEMHDAMHPKMQPNKLHSAMHPSIMHPVAMDPETVHPSTVHTSDMHPNAMHPSDMHPAMHPNMHPNEGMDPENKMHPTMHPNSDMHPNMHPNEGMHPENKMHPTMHPNSDMHPNMHPSAV